MIVVSAASAGPAHRTNGDLPAAIHYILADTVDIGNRTVFAHPDKVVDVFCTIVFSTLDSRMLVRTSLANRVVL